MRSAPGLVRPGDCKVLEGLRMWGGRCMATSEARQRAKRDGAPPPPAPPTAPPTVQPTHTPARTPARPHPPHHPPLPPAMRYHSAPTSRPHTSQPHPAPVAASLHPDCVHSNLAAVLSRGRCARGQLPKGFLLALGQAVKECAGPLPLREWPVAVWFMLEEPRGRAPPDALWQNRYPPPRLSPGRRCGSARALLVRTPPSRPRGARGRHSRAPLERAPEAFVRARLRSPSVVGGPRVSVLRRMTSDRERERKMKRENERERNRDKTTEIVIYREVKRDNER